MATIVTGDMYKKIDGKLEEIKRQLRQKGGYPFDIDKLNLGLQVLVEGKFEALNKFPCEFNVRHLIPQGWMVLEDVEPTANLDLFKLKFESPLKDGESWVDGDEMRKRAVVLKGNFGLSDAPAFIAQSDKLPAEFKHSDCIILPGTVLRYQDGRRLVPYLLLLGSRLVLRFFWLDDSFHSNVRLARSE